MYLSSGDAENNEEIHSILIRLYEIEIKADLKFLRNEARVLALIKSDPGNSVKYYLSKSGISNRWFYKIIANLIQGGFLSEGINAEDNRQKILF